MSEDFTQAEVELPPEIADEQPPSRHIIQNMQAQLADALARLAEVEEHPHVKAGLVGLSPGDTREQRQAVAVKAVKAATDLLDAYYELLKLREQRLRFASPFIDTDFIGTAGLSQLDANMIGSLFDFVVPELQAVIERAAGTVVLSGGEFSLTVGANAGRNKQLLFQVRAG